jgi:hypothetical protein
MVWNWGGFAKSPCSPPSDLGLWPPMPALLWGQELCTVKFLCTLVNFCSKTPSDVVQTPGLSFLYH